MAIQLKNLDVLDIFMDMKTAIWVLMEPACTFCVECLNNDHVSILNLEAEVVFKMFQHCVTASFAELHSCMSGRGAR